MKKITMTKKPIESLAADVLFSYTNTDFVKQKNGVWASLLGLAPDLAKEIAGVSMSVKSAQLSGPAGLPYKLLCHVCIAGLANDPTESTIRGGLRYGFNLLLEDQAYHSFVIPALYQEASGMPLEMCAELVVREAVVFAEDPSVEKIFIQSTNKEEYNAYNQALKRMLA